MTHRQFLTWHTWLKEEWENPDRHDVYIMMLARTVQTLLMSNEESKKITIGDFKVRFSESKEPPVRSTPQQTSPSQTSIDQRTIMGKAAWASRLANVPGVVYNPPPPFSSENV